MSDFESIGDGFDGEESYHSGGIDIDEEGLGLGGGAVIGDADFAVDVYGADVDPEMEDDEDDDGEAAPDDGDDVSNQLCTTIATSEPLHFCGESLFIVSSYLAERR